MAHQTFEQIRDEVMIRLGRKAVTAFNARAEALVDACYREICQTWFHHELVDDPTPTAALSQAASSVAVPADCYLVFGVRLLSGSTPKGRLGWMRPIDLFGRFSATQGLPEHYTRFGQKIYFEKPADAAYTVEIFSYRRPTDPVFTGAPAPEIDELFDEVLIEWATAKGQGALWRPDLAAQGVQSLADFWQRAANPPIASGRQRDRDETDVSDVPYVEGLG